MVMKYLLLSILLPLFLFAMPHNESKIKEENLLPQSKALYADDIFDINSTTSRSNFQAFNGGSFNLYQADKNIWFEIKIDAKEYKEPILYITTPLLTKINIYNKRGKLLQSLSYGKQKETLLPYYKLPAKKMQLYLQLQSHYIPLIGSIWIAEKESFLLKDANKRFYLTLLLGILVAVMLLLLIEFLIKRKKEILFLLFVVLLFSYYLFTYSGLAAAVASSSYALLDIAITTIKINFITILLALYTGALLKVTKRGVLYTTLKVLALTAAFELFVSGFLNIPLLYALLPLIATIIVGIVALYRKLQEENIFFFPLFGYIILFLLFVSQIAIAMGALGFSLLQESMPLLITVALLFIAGQYLYSYIQKEKSDCNSVIEGLDRKYLIENMLQTKKEELDALNEAKEILKHDIHTIIDNNFKQILLSLQTDGSNIDYTKLSKQLTNIEQRMQAISICYTHMLESKNLTTIDMKRVVEEIIEQIKMLYADQKCPIKILTDIDATLAVNDAVIAATAISEMVMDSYKKGCNKEKGFVLLITLKQTNGSYSLSVKDYPEGKEALSEKKTTLQKLKEKLQQLRMGNAKER